MNRVFEYAASERYHKSVVVAADAAAARRRLESIGINASYVEYSLPLSLSLMAQPDMNKQQRAFFYRNLAARLERRTGQKDAIVSILTGAYELPVVRAAFAVLDFIDQGQTLSEALRRSGFPPEETGFLASGERAGQIAPSAQALHKSMFAQIKIKKQIQSSLLMPGVSLVLLWIITFPAFAVFMTRAYDTIIVPTKGHEQMSAAYRGFFEVCLALRDAMPLSAVAYYILPFVLWAAARFAGVTAADVFSKITIIRRFFMFLDIQQACAILAQQTKFQSALPDAVSAAAVSMRTKMMRGGMSKFAAFLRQGNTVETAALKSPLPLSFSSELASAAKSPGFAERLEDYGALVSNDIEEHGKKMQTAIYVAVILLVSSLVLALVLLTYIPVIRSTLRLAG